MEYLFKKFSHGGPTFQVSKLISKPIEEIIDLSSSVNPLNFFLPFLPDRKKLSFLLNKYPDPEVYELRQTISEVYQVPWECILCGNGSMELIYLTLRSFSWSSVLIWEPTFIEYYKGCKIFGIYQVERIFSLEKEEGLEKLKQALSKNFNLQAVFICNPNNPTGWLISKKSLLDLIETFPSVIFLIDEAFIDFALEESLLREASFYSNLIVFRSLTKFFGLAGIRLGYMVAHKKIIEKLKLYQEPWSVNSLAQYLGNLLVKNTNFIQRTLNFFKREKLYVENFFKKWKINYFPSVANFYLFILERGAEFTDYLLRKGILIRNCYNFYGLNENFLRVSVKRRGENRKFLEELKKWLEDF
ncbi:MAG: pyridoxal phosphate-dependent class II aminotransferase [Thermodesulfobacteriaceae bacterium]|nr:pyridoxal phosphate-dependent class II aminotransferase [Thermodesulfobacteriaceae bacterium]MCX8041714.1 pyridoxal phosphate-dependent class II aminotransferase [Thermodesulfobacteriaceae bacterium]MDW8136012.1 pyridoxal phosphate-dependent class II aminotransferase [Thermodesulfobacterium sp.]